MNINIIKKIESSEINKKNLAAFRKAFEELQFIGDTAYIHMGVVKDADVLVILADFFMKMAEATWCIVSGIYGKKLIIIMRKIIKYIFSMEMAGVILVVSAFAIGLATFIENERNNILLNEGVAIDEILTLLDK